MLDTRIGHPVADLGLALITLHARDLRIFVEAVVVEAVGLIVVLELIMVELEGVFEFTNIIGLFVTFVSAP